MVERSGLPANEAERLSAVRRYQILDTPPDGTFDRITALAARIFNVPISIVSIVDEDRIWFKSHHGLEVDEIDREPGLCASAILQTEPWVVNDARVDPRTLANPLVCGELGLRFYAGIPLRTSDGYNLGTFNIIDVEPRELTGEEMSVLEDLASIVVDELELRLAAVRLQAHVRAQQRHALEINDSVVQSLSIATLALKLGEFDKANAATSSGLASAVSVARELLDSHELALRPGDFVRHNPNPSV